MKGRKLIILTALAAVLCSCGPRKKAASAPAVQTREFPMAEVPMMITEPAERLVWLGQHFWDRFTATDSLYFCDSVTVNGVTLENLEKQMGIFASILQEVPLSDGVPAGNVLPQTVALATRYFYDPNSPVRSEDLYLPFVTRLAASALIDPDYRMGYEWDAEKCALNRTGTKAADFVFVDTDGRRRTLYGIKAHRILLIFGNPDCTACKEIQETFTQYPELSAQIADGTLKVVDIYIDEDIELWKARKAAYPASWINGYDPTFSIRTDLIYNVRAVPSLYLLDENKTVLLKDAVPERVLQALL